RQLKTHWPTGQSHRSLGFFPRSIGARAYRRVGSMQAGRLHYAAIRKTRPSRKTRVAVRRCQATRYENRQSPKRPSFAARVGILSQNSLGRCKTSEGERTLGGRACVSGDWRGGLAGAELSARTEKVACH